MAALLRGGGGRGDGRGRQAFEIGFRLQHQREGLFVAQHVLREGRAQRRETLGDGGEALLLVGGQTRAGAAEGEPAALDETARLRVQARGVGVDGVHPREQFVVEQHIGVFAREARLDLQLDRLDGVVRGGADEVVEYALDPVERLARALQAEDGVFEARGLGFDRVQLRTPFRHRRVERGAEMLQPDLRERRLAEGGGPGGKQGILGQGGTRVGAKNRLLARLRGLAPSCAPSPCKLLHRRYLMLRRRMLLFRDVDAW